MRIEQWLVLWVAGFVIWNAPSVWGRPFSVDLVVDVIYVQPERPSTATPVEITVGVRNKGSLESDFCQIRVTLRQQDLILKRLDQIPVLAKVPSAGTALAIPVELGILDEGDYTLVIDVDPDGKISEINEDNNSATKEFRVGTPDFRSVTYH